MKGEKGQSLAEALIAVMLVAVASTGLSAMMLSASGAKKKTDVRERMAYHGNLLQQQLKAYVTADTGVTQGAPGDRPWHLPGDACADCWALAPGLHDATAALPPELREPPVSATLRYEVSAVPVNGEDHSRVRVLMTWED